MTVVSLKRIQSAAITIRVMKITRRMTRTGGQDASMTARAAISATSLVSCLLLTLLTVRLGTYARSLPSLPAVPTESGCQTRPRKCPECRDEPPDHAMTARLLDRAATSQGDRPL